MKHDIRPAANLTHMGGDPLDCYARWRQSPPPGEALLLVDFQFTPHWLDGAAAQWLTAIYHVSGADLRVAVTDRALEAAPLAPGEQFSRWVAQHSLVYFSPENPLELAPVTIDKLWGREIWFTGVERRGVCEFTRGEARVPIPWLQAALPGAAAGRAGEPLLLLKILDPSPQPGRGELYFELHEKKWEVYVVTGVDRQAWPDGVGYVRYGFDPGLVSRYADDDRFRADYLDAVKAYETQRRALEALEERGQAAEAWMLAHERRLCQRMHRFTHLHPLREGDVLQVPPLLPHALQHGIRTVEFQTPNYERKILSFGQKVLTQSHWDTSEAVAQMRLLPPSPSLPVPQSGGDGLTVEQIADCAGFDVLRARLRPGTRWQLECEHSYLLVMVAVGMLDLGGGRYEPGQALLLPRSWRGSLVASSASPTLVLLLARPRS